MPKHNHTRLIMDLTDALRGSVPERDHNDALAALKRCQEMIANLANTVCSLDASGSYKELVSEASLYANILSGILGERGINADGWVNISKGYDPYKYLADKGVTPKPKSTRQLMEEKWEADRKAQEDKINQQLSELEWKQAQQRLKRELREAQKTKPRPVPIIDFEPFPDYINRLRAEQGLDPIMTSAKRGRPTGSKNKPKGIVSKVNAILEAKKGRKK